MWIPELKKKIGRPLTRIVRASSRDRIHLRDVWQIFHTIGRPCVAVCPGKLDAGWDRIGVCLVNDARADCEKLLNCAAHVNIRKYIPTCRSATRSAWGQCRVLA